MAKEKVDVLIEGGKATAAPPLGPALGPMGVNIGQVVADINAKTKDFQGMKVPVTVTIDKSTKEYSIKVGTPPATQLIKKEANIKKGAGNPLTEKAADLTFDQVIKVANMKSDALLGKTIKMKVMEILGTCQSMGVWIEGTFAHDMIDAVKRGEYNSRLGEGKDTAHLEVKSEYADKIAQAKVEESEAEEAAQEEADKDKAKVEAAKEKSSESKEEKKE